jgi:hypothetical protein
MGTTMMIVGGSNSSSQAWADVIEGTEESDVIVGTPGADLTNIKGSGDVNYGDTVLGNSSGNDNIISGDGNDGNSENGGDDNIVGRDVMTIYLVVLAQIYCSSVAMEKKIQSQTIMKPKEI